MDAAAAGSEPALNAVRSAGDALGIALANAVNLLDIGAVVLGGIYAPLSGQLIPVIEGQLARRALSWSWSPVTVRRALASDYAALTGAALTVLAGVIENPSHWLRSRAG